MHRIGSQNALKWSEDQVGTLKQMWSAGSSAGAIAEALGTSRNSVIGKVHRLKLPKRDMTTKHTTKVQRTDARRHREPVKPRVNKGAAIIARAIRKPPTPPPAFEPEPFDDEVDVGIDFTKRIGLLDLTNHTCRWPVGRETGARQMFCGCHVSIGPYCRTHADKAEVRR